MNIFQQGFLTSIYFDTVSDVDKRNKLNNDQLQRIATVLGELSKIHDLYDLLFEQPNQLMQVGKITVNTKDLAMLVILDNTYTRGYFVKNKSKATSDTHMSQGVPLALYGAKQVYNKKYSSWLDIDNPTRCDIFLPADLNSYTIDPDSGDIVQAKHYGLITFIKNNIHFTNDVIQELRQDIPNWKAGYNPKKVIPRHITDPYGKYFNKCGHKLRALILQGWIWSDVCRNSDMITDIHNWDNLSSPVTYQGLKSSDSKTSPGLLKFLNGDILESNGVIPEEPKPVEDRLKL